jgi:TonB family protein
MLELTLFFTSTHMNAVSARQPWEGKVVEGKYPLLELLGTGPRGLVFRTEFSGPSGRQSGVVKLIPTHSGNIEAELSRIRGVMELSHSNLIKIFEAGQCQNRGEAAIYIVMEYAEENLGQVVPSRALTVSETEQLLAPLLEALSYLHAKGFVHGRVQPSNVMAVGDTLKLSSDRIRRAGEAAVVQSDNAGFSAPEAVKGELTPASDVWSLGATVVAALGRTSGISLGRTVSIVPESMPEPFKQIARECLRANPNERCTLEQIKSWLDKKTAPFWMKAPAKPSASPKAIKRMGVPLLTLGLVLGVLWFVHASRSGSAPRPESSESPAAPLSSASSASIGQKGSIPGEVAERVLPNISRGARNTITGKVKVTVQLNVDPSGNVTEARLTNPGPSKYFANQALQSARQWKFKPPQVDGQPAASEWSLKYFFGRAGTEVVPAQLH